MNDIIQKMRGELRSILKKSVDDYPTKDRDKWLFDWPSQVCFCNVWCEWVTTQPVTVLCSFAHPD